ncbi:hypothetical protein AYM02_05460 [Coxiella burnetii]|nr:hypothetical protein AYM38_05395 [Coxiella burnetii]ATN68722.1 hypothetical protein AYM00_05690 [Coxiella burnetii]ATN70647.1 hypothetical protein AYM02_05460 [Coxiella burnetii]ATN72569.1 hypothetical protein AYM11_05280 [Coxiella burnetii]AZV75401.1 hypothetical protein D6219_06085 [Coxiella burnetii]
MSVGSFGIFGFSAGIAVLFSASVALSTYVASLQSEGDGNLFTNTINITSAIVSFALFFDPLFCF